MQIFKKLLDGCSDGICIVDDTEPVDHIGLEEVSAWT